MPPRSKGPGAQIFAGFTPTNLKVGALWGEPYGWDGQFVDNTAVFHVMHAAITGELPEPAPGQ